MLINISRLSKSVSFFFNVCFILLDWRQYKVVDEVGQVSLRFVYSYLLAIDWTFNITMNRPSFI